VRRFRFSLERLLRLRTHEERAARRALAQGVQEVARLDHRLAVLQSDLRSLAELDGTGTRLLPLARALEHGFRAEWSRVRAARAEAEQRLETVRAEYQARRAARDGLGRLRARRRADWLADVSKQEQGELDEVARARATGRREVLR
jgi:flagellar export protein FliJ